MLDFFTPKPIEYIYIYIYSRNSSTELISCLMVWILLYCLKKCGFENLNNPLFEKPKTDRNRNTPKPIDFQPFQLVSVENFTNQNIRFRLAIPIQTDQNRTEHTPSVNRGYSSTPFYCNSSQFGFLLNNITMFLLKKKN